MKGGVINRAIPILYKRIFYTFGTKRTKKRVPKVKDGEKHGLYLLRPSRFKACHT